MSNTQKEEKKDKNVEIKELGNSLLEITGEIPVDVFEKERPQAVKRFSEKAEVAGFRKGHIPENVIEGKFGEMAILEEMAQTALAKKYPEILKENEIDAIGHPEVSITKIAKGSPLGFKIKTAIMPVIDLPDYKKLAKENADKKEEVKVEEKEIDEVIQHIRTQRKRMEDSKKSEKSDTKTKKTEGDKNPETKKKEEVLPPLTDEMAKELGFDSAEDFKKIIHENLKQEKETRVKDKHRTAIIDSLLEKTKVSLPDIVIDSELDRTMAELKGEIANMGLEFPQYLEHVKKTEEDLRKASRPDAEKRAKSQLVINKIAVVESIKPDKDHVEDEVKKLTEKYADADPVRTRAYIEMILTNEAVLKFLEEQ